MRLALVLGLAACGGEAACEAYLRAQEACLGPREADGWDVRAWADDPAVCYFEHPPAMRALHACRREAFRLDDCTTDAGWDAVRDAWEACE